ncbi:conserved hypothetical protein [Microbacterium sp. C448]|uniref:DUF4166 domain-containing protein n=1 Tax=Microbacterium TaxID=33882 RepID=UPI0003DE4984|nr:MULTISPECIES: DUF4166 domain-containing protein [Microbacterium]CDK00177.1 conserved hypothetical protein [Microbacterium sp. C448]|tara:strand:+ start:6210 stop:6872 length:663 start_codon:yes stop_codon:yes gene_type:complete
MFSKRASVEGGSPGVSVYERVLGDDFGALDPQLQRYFGLIPEGFVGVGSGRYRVAGLCVRALRPLFAVLARRGIAFAEKGADVPFSVRNIPHPDGTLSAVRTFEFVNGTRAMRDVMRIDGERLVDRIGAKGEIEVELSMRVSEGRLRMESERLALRLWGLRLPLPRVVRVLLTEQALPVGAQRVELRILAPVMGEIYGYSGDFTYEVRRDEEPPEVPGAG